MTSCGAGVAVFLGFAALPSLAGSLTVGTKTNTKPLNTSGCYAPSSDGGWGFCGPFSCTDNYDTCVDDDGSGGGPLTVDGVTGSWATSESDCKPFLSSSYDDDEDIQDWSPTKNCDNTCTQETSGVCSAEFLAGVLKGQGVKWAYCNDRYLFMYTDGQPTIWNANLNDVPYPPGDSSGNYRTGMDSMDLTKGVELYYPLNVTLLNTDANDNNVETWASATYLYSSLWDDDSMGDVGIPADSGIGVSVSGQMIYPIYNNVAVYTPQQCEVDSCNEHVGQGGGQPHLHGDPFGDEAPTRCLYGPSNYTGPEYGETGHPPVIGFGADGILIYGRYLYDTQLGYQAPLLDNCGGHIHSVSATSAQDPYGLVDEYHYHTQVFDATADSSAVADEDDSYSATTTGPLNCYKANISASPGSMALYEANSGMSAGKSEMENRCCDMTDYYILTGLSFPDAGSDLSVKSSSTCSSPAAPANGYHSGVCSSEGTTMYSGWTCNVTCNDGFYLNGTTQCVGGVLNEASCDSFAPSNSPTTGPTLPPTTSTPTLSPTTGTTVTVDASMTMSGLNASQVDDDDLAAIKTGLSSVLDGVDESDIYGLVVTAARRRRLTHEETRRLRTRAAADAEGAESRARQLLGSSTATVTFSVSLDTSSTSDFSSADALYTSVTSDLSDAASDSTDLITAIQSAASSNTFAATDVESTSTTLLTRSPSPAPSEVPTPSPTPVPVASGGGGGGSDDGDDGSSSMGLFIGLGVGIPLLAAMCFYAISLSKDTSKASATTGTTAGPGGGKSSAHVPTQNTPSLELVPSAVSAPASVLIGSDAAAAPAPGHRRNPTISGPIAHIGHLPCPDELGLPVHSEEEAALGAVAGGP